MGSALVELEDHEQAVKAIKQLNGAVILSNRISVQHASNKELYIRRDSHFHKEYDKHILCSYYNQFSKPMYDRLDRLEQRITSLEDMNERMIRLAKGYVRMLTLGVKPK